MHAIVVICKGMLLRAFKRCKMIIEAWDDPYSNTNSVLGSLETFGMNIEFLLGFVEGEEKLCSHLYLAEKEKDFYGPLV